MAGNRIEGSRRNRRPDRTHQTADRRKYRGESPDRIQRDRKTEHRKKAGSRIDRNTGNGRNVRNNRRGHRPKKRMSVWKKLLIAFMGLLVCIICVIGVAAAYGATKLQQLNTEDIPRQDIVMNNLEEGVGEGFTNFALFGGDSREGELDIGIRTDTIIVASLNNKTKEIKMVSVYRDSLLDLSEGTLQKCNGAYSYGGPKQAIDMLNMNLDLEIEDYVTVDFAVVSDVIDLLGGVEIEVQEAEIPYINKYLKETAEVAGKKANKVTQAGMQTLDGAQATTYARIRSTAGGDYRRAERQRYVIEKMVEKVMRSDLATINAIIDSVFPKIKTSLSATEILDYAKSFNKYKLGDNIGFPTDKTTDTLPGLGSIVIPVTLSDNVSQLHEFLYGDEEYEPSAEVKSISRRIVNLVGPRVPDGDIQWESPSDKKQNSDSVKTTDTTNSGQPAIQISE